MQCHRASARSNNKPLKNVFPFCAYKTINPQYITSNPQRMFKYRECKLIIQAPPHELTTSYVFSLLLLQHFILNPMI